MLNVYDSNRAILIAGLLLQSQVLSDSMAAESSRLNLCMGKPITVKKSPSSLSTSCPPIPWMPYAPALSSGSFVATYARMSASVRGANLTLACESEETAKISSCQPPATENGEAIPTITTDRVGERKHQLLFRAFTRSRRVHCDAGVHLVPLAAEALQHVEGVALVFRLFHWRRQRR